jgi:hypothetical protein
MLQFNVSLDGNDSMFGGSGGPARPRDHRGGMLITHQYTSLHKRASYYTPYYEVCNESRENHVYYT